MVKVLLVEDHEEIWDFLSVDAVFWAIDHCVKRLGHALSASGAT
jgi:hypothetical protein